MELLEKLRKISDRAEAHAANLETEEATKNALIMPFLQALGYDVFDPSEVVPEFTADVGVKKGEKVDYALKVAEEVVILVEAKKVGAPLSSAHSGQLFRYFNTVRTARVGLLTNGVEYQLYSDLDEPNVMDDSPFLVARLDGLNEGVVEELGCLRRDHFDLDQLLSAASDMKYLRGIRSALVSQFEEPDDDFVRYFFNKANPKGRFVDAARQQFRTLVKSALAQEVRDRVAARLQSALAREAEPRPAAPVEVEEPASPAAEGEIVEEPLADKGIITTDDERLGFAIVCAIVAQVVDIARVAQRDTKSYFGVLLDDNNRKPICRLRFNRDQKYIGTFDEEKVETRHPIERLEDLYGFSELLRNTVLAYGSTSPSAGANGVDATAE